MSNYHVYRFGHFWAKVLPFRLSQIIVTFLCDMHYFFSKRDRWAVENNLKIVFKKDRVPSSLVREVFRNFGKYLLEFFTMTQRVNPSFAQSHVRINNIEYLKNVLEKGKGGIIVSAHLGNWEMGGGVLPAFGFPLAVLALSHKDPRVNALFNAQREALGVKVIQTDTAAVRRLIEHLRKNHLVAIVADRDFGNNGILMDFLGQKTLVPKGPAFFSIKTGSPIVPTFFIRREDGHFEINAHPPINPPQVSNGEITDDLLRGYIAQYLKVMEQEIKANPTQWLLFREFAQA
ncbi:MAG: lysophospholipid acyltransferase family protein [Candidatus Omnitrophica bacterium]|nr:lysophospholipid acyltransferase family protein [Candidatus Omnitrophota bacterium]